MVEHIKVLGWIGIVKAIAGLIAGPFLLVKSMTLDASSYLLPAVSDETVVFDAWAFRIAALLLIGGGALCLIQGIGVLRARGWARRLGLVLAVLDILNLALFPLSTALGLYGLVVYRHPEVVERFSPGTAPKSLVQVGA